MYIMCKLFAFYFEALCMEALRFTRSFEHSMFAFAPDDMSNSDCRLSVFNLKYLEEPLLTPTHGKLFLQRQRVEELNTIFSCMFIYLYVEVMCLFC